MAAGSHSFDKVALNLPVVQSLGGEWELSLCQL